MEYWHNLEDEVRKMKVKALWALLGKLSDKGSAEFFKLYSDGIQGIRTDGAFEQAFDFAEEILRREEKDAATD